MNALPRKPVYVLIAMLLVIGLYVSGNQLPVEGQSRSQLESRKRANAAELQRIRGQLAKLREEKGNMEKIIAQVDKDMDEAYDELLRIQRQEKRLISQHKYIKLELEEAKVSFRAHRDRYKKRIISIYKTGQVAYVEILFKSRNMSDFFSRWYYLRKLTDRDRKRLKDLAKLRQDLDTKEKVYAKKTKEIAINRAEQEEAAKQIEKIHDAKQQALTRLKSDEAALAKREQILNQENSRISKQLSAMIAQASSKSGANIAHTYAGGKFRNPICNNYWRVTSGYGYRRAPVRGASTFHGGIDLACSYKQTVCAVADGTIIFVGRKGGYGNTVMVAHSQNLVTLYAHGMGFPANTYYGKTVRRGDPVLLCDSTGISTGNHLHFTVYKNNATVNPMNFF